MMNRYHYIDHEGNISDALPLEALRKINLPPTTKVLLEGAKQWTTLGEVSRGGPVIFPAPPVSPPPTVPPAIASQTAGDTQARPGASPSPPSEKSASQPPTPQSGADKKSTSNAKKGCLGCLGVIVLLIIIGAIFGSSDSGKTTSPSSSEGAASGWGSSLEKRLVGVYECPNPMWALQLKYSGDYAMEALQSGNSFRGTWTASGGSGVLNGTYPSKASMTFSIQSDGAIVVDKYGYTFVKTR